jgi:hypothetical protein
MLDIIAISVSTNYDDILNIVLPQNYKFFKEWFIITDKDDILTLDILIKYDFKNVKVLYYDFRNNNAIFDKGGAIQFAQLLINNRYKASNICILLIDSDIYLPDNFDDLIDKINIMENTLYGTEKRNDYYSYNNFKKNIIDREFEYSQSYVGYFQMYINNINYLYNNSKDASHCDLEFRDLFANKSIIRNLVVKHLGKGGINWQGRKDRNDFIIKN